GHKKIAYAASFGSGVEGPDSYEQLSAYYLKQFDAISIREKEAAEKAKQKTGRTDIANVLDPVFLCPVQIYEEPIRYMKAEPKDPFAFAYILRNDFAEENLRLIEMIGEHCQASVQICVNPWEYDNMRNVYGNRIMPVLSVEEWLFYMKHTAYYFGDSYHGLCFSLIFHKPFLIVYRANSYRNVASERFKSLLKIIGLEDRLLEDIPVDLNKAGELIRKPVDWEAVDEKLMQHRDFSVAWLKNALGSRSEKLYTAEDMIKDREQRKKFSMYDELYRKYNMLFRELEETKKRFAEIRN
ncbi:MAG: polysaccharide pyruvyl transferase family protein, partial [Lachnospiraceae bacterium]|nr:polysaccharide pyruvyl transferase family protein [Lachnospiraceae bacterium]